MNKHDQALAMVLHALGGKVVSTKPITGTGSLPPYEPVSTTAFAPKPPTHTTRQNKKRQTTHKTN